ncbi:hypothetical protein CHS0354_020468 [Potamilus streckersoni]|uniref:Uracil-DNA glycosylase-like domain-containing protein n=1 Tax=Potamilus streckersoni TaxID=2493646 RepID=A0AAE0SZF9_9BIVA|nr:hypothetical protein CHS0354_020468 [Potamilus streckersoni]
MGLSFSVPKGINIPPSLKNIYKELDRDPEISGFKEPDHGCLEKWSKDGVLLLNATLTVEAHKPNSHASFGWQKFTDHVIKTVSDCGSSSVFVLWGGFAHKKEKLIDKSKHKVIKTAHPSPLSFNKFKGCGCFSECNKYLKEIGQTPIDWSL